MAACLSHEGYIYCEGEPVSDLKGELGDDFDHHDPEHYRSAERAWAAMQAQQPGLEYSRKYGGFFIATRYADVREVAIDYRSYCSAQGINIPPLPLRAPMISVELAAESAEKV
jgi:cytochrome P450